MGTQSASRFGWGKRIPLPGRVLPPGKKSANPDINSILQIIPDNLLLISAQPSVNANIINLHLRETGGLAASLVIKDSSGRNFKLQETNVIGEAIGQENTNINFKPREVKFIKIQLD